MTIANRIQSLRKAKGISQEQLADQLGVSRQAVSKWESEQSTPDIEKIILMSDFFNVTTDSLLKGIEISQDNNERKPDANIFTVVATTLNFMGLIIAILIWIEKQTAFSVAIGLIFMAMGCMIFSVGQITGENRKSSKKYFCYLNVWILLLIPISCIFNFLDGTFGGFWWTFTPFPKLGNSFLTYALCWITYFVICIFIDWKIYKIS